MIYIYITNVTVNFYYARAVCYVTVYLLLFLNKQTKSVGLGRKGNKNFVTHV